MNAKQYAQLMGLATKANTNLVILDAQITAFNAKCDAVCFEVKRNFDVMHTSLQAFAAAAAPLAKDQLDTLHGIKKALDKNCKNLHKEAEKPAQKLQQNIASVNKEITTKIIAELDSVHEPCHFDLAAIRTLVANMQVLMANSNKKLDGCFKNINRLQTQGAILKDLLQRLDLPEYIQQTTKQVQQITADLARLDLHLQTTPQQYSQYQSAFLPLRAALLGLGTQSVTFTTTTAADDVTSTTANLASPGLTG